VLACGVERRAQDTGEVVAILLTLSQVAESWRTNLRFGWLSGNDRRTPWAVNREAAFRSLTPSR
jgi:hypothetical protein